ncbi:MAG TPA: ABC transporter permease [Candidatus Saccharimonadales bacterium]|nr:ABC transporter permease [Candidatus Saccharimonadales bacterium]
MSLYRRIFSKQNRALLAELVRTDFKLRYQGSFLGYAWSLLRPLMLFGILYVIFALVVKSGDGIPHFPVYLLLGVVLWTFFTDMTTQSLGSIVGRGDLIRKIRIPRWIIVLSSSLAALINLGLNLVVVGVVMAVSHNGLMSTVVFMPLLLLEIYLFALGISLFLSAAFVKFRDIGFIWEVILQVGFYLTPILYAMTLIPEQYQKFQILNPLAQVVQDSRYALVSHSPKVVTASRLFDGGWYRFIPVAIVLVVLVVGLLYFKKQASSFAENV